MIKGGEGLLLKCLTRNTSGRPLTLVCAVHVKWYMILFVDIVLIITTLGQEKHPKLHKLFPLGSKLRSFPRFHSIVVFVFQLLKTFYSCVTKKMHPF